MSSRRTGSFQRRKGLAKTDPTRNGDGDRRRLSGEGNQGAQKISGQICGFVKLRFNLKNDRRKIFGVEIRIERIYVRGTELEV